VSETQLLTIASSLVATLFGILIMVLGWLGNKTYSKLDEISRNLIVMASELHDRINGIDVRLTVVETRCIDRRKAENHEHS